MEERLTRFGITIGYLSSSTSSDGRCVLDAQHRFVGWISDQGTWDANRRRLADFPDAGLLLGQQGRS